MGERTPGDFAPIEGARGSEGEVMAAIVFGIATFGLLVLSGANSAVIVARLTGHEKFAGQIISAFSRVVWLFTLGDDGERHRRRAMRDHSRA